jgi:hypothetical protein
MVMDFDGFIAKTNELLTQVRSVGQIPKPRLYIVDEVLRYVLPFDCSCFTQINLEYMCR